MSRNVQQAKQVVLTFQSEFDAASREDLERVASRHMASDYRCRAVHPFNEMEGTGQTIEKFWQPLRAAFRSLQRREHISFCGSNDVDDGDSIWLCSGGHFMGLFDEPWLDVQPTRQLTMLPYAEFHQIDGDKIVQSAMFCDILSVMQQARQYPLPPQTGAAILRPGPLTNDGIQKSPADPAETALTIELLNRMIADLDVLNKSGEDICEPEYLARCWREDMAWYGPAGIGATYTIERYQKQHQFPFRQGLSEKVYNGHVARIAEGRYAGFFGWPNLNNKLAGGFLGMPSGGEISDMRVVDIYRREGDKLAENWVYIDLLHYFHKQGLDLLKRNRELHGE